MYVSENDLIRYRTRLTSLIAYPLLPLVSIIHVNNVTDNINTSDINMTDIDNYMFLTCCIAHTHINSYTP